MSMSKNDSIRLIFILLYCVGLYIVSAMPIDHTLYRPLYTSTGIAVALLLPGNLKDKRWAPLFGLIAFAAQYGVLSLFAA